MKNPRTLSFEVLKKVIIDNKFSNHLLNDISNLNLDLKSKNFIFNIVHGTLKYKIFLEYITNKHLLNPKKTKKEAQILIWMSLYQIRFMDKTPNYAIVNEAVEIAKQRFPKLKNFINACLQKSLRMGESFFEIDVKNKDLKFCISNSYPYNFYKKLLNDYGEEKAKLVVKDSLELPLIYFRINTLKISEKDFLDKYKDEYVIKKHKTINCFTSEKNVVKSDIYNQGLINIQDAGSILVSEIMNPTKNSKVLDMCAAPGGKLTHLAALMENSGTIDAFEIIERKISKIEQNINRLAVTNVNLKCFDSTQIDVKEYYDYILLDAPCSGLGVMKRKQEIKNNNIDYFFKELLDIQKRLLETAYNSLKKGGKIVYSTCTINNDENESQISKFLLKFPNMEIESKCQLLGYEENSDGFFICKMIKK